MFGFAFYDCIHFGSLLDAAGAIQYLDGTTPGAIEETPTSTAGEIVRIVGYAISTTDVFFNPDKTYIEIA